MIIIDKKVQGLSLLHSTSLVSKRKKARFFYMTRLYGASKMKSDLTQVFLHLKEKIIQA
jgi:hypothetical protein